MVPQQAQISPAQIRNYTGGASVGADYTAYIPEGLGSLDDGPAIQACIDGMPSHGKLILPSGLIKAETGIVLNKPILMQGGGMASNYFDHFGTRLVTTSKTINQVRISSPACKIKDIDIYNDASSAPTAGSNLVIDSTQVISWGQQYGVQAGSWDLESVSFFGGFDNIYHLNGMESRMTNCQLFSPVRRGMHYECDANHDAGDLSVVGCNFYPQKYNAEAAFYQKSGGGVKFDNCKFNGRDGKYFKNHYEADLTASTSILLFSNTSMENHSEYAIRLRGNGFQMVDISGNNQFASYTNFLGHVWVDNCEGVMVGSNIFRKSNSTDAALKITNCQSVTVNPNQYLGYSGVSKNLAGSTGVRDFDI